MRLLAGGLSERLGTCRVPPSEVRTEVWALGGRYAGRVAEGARKELASPHLSLRQAVLLCFMIRDVMARAEAAWRTKI